MNPYSIYITPTAVDDINEALTYYNEKVPDLRFDFIEEVESCFKSISYNPDGFAKRYKDIRGKLLKRFPYIILYRATHHKNIIEVIRVFNTYQNPYWM